MESFIWVPTVAWTWSQNKKKVHPILRYRLREGGSNVELLNDDLRRINQTILPPSIVRLRSYHYFFFNSSSFLILHFYFPHFLLFYLFKESVVGQKLLILISNSGLVIVFYTANTFIKYLNFLIFQFKVFLFSSFFLLFYLIFIF